MSDGNLQFTDKGTAKLAIMQYLKIVKIYVTLLSSLIAHSSQLYPTHDITPRVPAMAVSTAISSLSISFQFFIFV